LGIPVANGYGLTEAGTAVTVNDLKPFRADTVGKPLPGMEVQIRNADSDGIGEVAVRSKTVMAGYLNEPQLTAETIVDGCCAPATWVASTPPATCNSSAARKT